MNKIVVGLVFGVLLGGAVVLAAPGASPWVEQYIQFDNKNDQTFRQAVNITATGSLTDAGAPLNVAGNLATLGGDPIVVDQGSTDGGLFVTSISRGRYVCSGSAASVTFKTAFAVIPMCSCLSLGTHICTGGTIAVDTAGFVCTTGEVLQIICIGER